MGLSVGFIGVGNMGAAMVRSLSKSDIIGSNNIFIYDVDIEKMKLLKDETGSKIAASALEIVDKADIIILAVKPNMAKTVLESVRHKFDDTKILVSIVVGLPIKLYKDAIGVEKKVIRTMPNTPALVGEGMTLISYDECVNEEDLEDVKAILNCFGKVEVLDEKLMNEVTALTGSSPAYVFMFIEAMADAAVLSGIPRNLAYKLASQSVLGSAKMVLETGKHPGELKDQVCSPAGTTIEAVSTLEKYGFRNAVIEAMNSCTKRSKEIGKLYE